MQTSSCWGLKINLYNLLALWILSGGQNIHSRLIDVSCSRNYWSMTRHIEASLSANQRPVSRSRDHSQPIRGQYKWGTLRPGWQGDINNLDQSRGSLESVSQSEARMMPGWQLCETSDNPRYLQLSGAACFCRQFIVELFVVKICTGGG